VSVNSRIHLACDWPGCTVEINTGVGLMPRAVASAEAVGWLHAAGVDLCGPFGHAGVAKSMGHLPVTAPAPRGRVNLSCLCGWVYPPPADPVVVAPRWSAHIADDVIPKPRRHMEGT
jgi:hypothetical protein